MRITIRGDHNNSALYATGHDSDIIEPLSGSFETVHSFPFTQPALCLNLHSATGSDPCFWHAETSDRRKNRC